jgi:glucose-1-phosphate adenylyltransferase
VLLRDHDDESSSHDFGKDVIPAMIEEHEVYAYNFLQNEVPGENIDQRGYWRDVGTIEAYYEASMDLRDVRPLLNLYNYEWPIRSTVMQYPPVKFVFDDEGRRGQAIDSIVASGAIISGATVRDSVIFNNVFVHSYSEVSDSVLMQGCNIGRHSRLRRVICDKNVTIDEGVVIGEDAEQDRQRFFVSPTGIVVIPKNVIVPREGELRIASASPPPGTLRPRAHTAGDVRSYERGGTGG